MPFKRIWHQAEVLAALEAGATLVTSSERLARAIALTYGEACHAVGEASWERPEALSYGAFLHRLYAEAVDAGMSSGGALPPKWLTRPAAEALWEEAVRATGLALLQPAATGKEAHAAWSLSIAYRLPLERIAASEDVDAQQFSAWAAHFKARSCELVALDEARITDWLATALREGRAVAPKQALFAGFDELTPQQREFIASLSVAGCRVEVLEFREASPPPALRTLCADGAAEMSAAARWARAMLDQDPDARAAIVARDLSSCRAALARALDDALCPAVSAGAVLSTPYDLSLGLPLASYPVVHAAFAVLELLGRRLTFWTASLLLRTPFLGGAEEERAVRARVELSLRERMSEELSPQILAMFVAGAGGLPKLLAALETLAETSDSTPARQTPSGWGETFKRALADSGWPGERALDSREFQAVEAFRELIGGLSQLDGVVGPAGMGEALGRLKRLAEEHIFQPASEDAPVQVLGLLETAGLHFDHLWILGLSDDAWPVSPRPIAFIPVSLQREYCLPHASAAIELDFAKRVTARLLASAGEVVVSTPGQESDQELRPSPLLSGLPAVDVHDLPTSNTTAYRETLQREYPRATEPYMDMRGPALRPGERAAGGTGLIRSQAACPFQAFGRYRLRTQPLNEPALGPDALERGLLVHEVLELVWIRLKDHASLAGLSASERQKLAEQAVTDVLAQRRRSLPQVYTPPMLELERRRLSERVAAWLEVDAARPPFKVMEREEWHEMKLGPLLLKTRVDRNDELPDGGRVIIDYKTGMARLKDWLDPRADDPQLPIYATGAGPELAGLAYASLKPGELGYRGLAARDGVAVGVVPYADYPNKPPEAEDWPALQAYWRRHLTALAEEYAAGEARVDPKTPDTCKHCHLAMLCRIHELAGAVEEEEVGDDA